MRQGENAWRKKAVPYLPQKEPPCQRLRIENYLLQVLWEASRKPLQKGNTNKRKCHCFQARWSTSKHRIGSYWPLQTSTLHVVSHDSILLQTSQPLIGNRETNGNGMRARVIFDSGSQKSYITQCARDQLNLPTISTGLLLIKTLGTESLS